MLGGRLTIIPLCGGNTDFTAGHEVDGSEVVPVGQDAAETHRNDDKMR